MHIRCCHKRHLKLKPHPVKPQYPELTMDTSKHTFLKLFWLDKVGQSSELCHQFQHFEGKKERKKNQETKNKNRHFSVKF